MIVTLEGLDEFERELGAAMHELREDLAQASLAAADAGVSEMQANHPYTDRTYQLSGGMHAAAVDGSDGREAEMRTQAEYASFVDKGTSRNRPYPFTPNGEAAAEKELEQLAKSAAQSFASKVSG